MLQPRLWLVAGFGVDHTPPEIGATVVDDQQRHWTRGIDGDFHMGAHHLPWEELHNRTDLVEVTAA